jgi:hypothetical protein
MSPAASRWQQRRVVLKGEDGEDEGHKEST